MSPSIQALLVTPICAHTFNMRPLVVGQDDVVHIKIAAIHQDIIVTFDGQESFRLLPGDEVTVSAATEGETLYYNTSFLAAGFLKSERFSPRLNLHMVLHCMFRHLAKRRGRDATLWDLACDAAVESVIDSLHYPCLTQRPTPARELFLSECRREMKVLSAEGIYRQRGHEG